MRSTLRASLALVLLPAAGSLCLAENEWTPQVGLRFGGEVESETISVEPLEIRPSLGLTYDHRLRERGWLWAAWSFQSTEFDAPGLLTDRDSIGLDIHYLHAGTSYRPKGGSRRRAGTHDRAHGFVMFGLGLTWVDPHPGEFETGLAGSLLVGGGFRVPIKPKLAFRLDIRGYATFTETKLRGNCGGAGCSIDFAGSGALQIDVMTGLTFRF